MYVPFAIPNFGSFFFQGSETKSYNGHITSRRVWSYTYFGTVSTLSSYCKIKSLKQTSGFFGMQSNVQKLQAKPLYGKD